MPVTVNWLDDSKKIVLYRIEGAWTLEEAMAALEQSRHLSEPPPRLFLTDVRGAKGLPFGILSRQDYIAKYMNADAGLTLIVGAHSSIRFLMNALVRLGVPIRNLVFVDTMDEALNWFSTYLASQEKEL